MNATGKTIADRLQDTPNRAEEITGHGARQGAAIALMRLPKYKDSIFLEISRSKHEKISPLQVSPRCRRCLTLTDLIGTFPCR